MAFFIRSASLQIGPLKYSMNDGFYFEFEVPFHDSEQLTTASFTVNNLNATSRAGIQKNQVVILNAGYEDDMGALFVGQVTSCNHRQNGVEWQTKITATAALDQWLRGHCTRPAQYFWTGGWGLPISQEYTLSAWTSVLWKAQRYTNRNCDKRM